eukprot:11209601-Lingulodinium_polyedra.AAC.1
MAPAQKKSRKKNPHTTAESSCDLGKNNTANIYTTSLNTSEEEAVNAARVNKNCVAWNPALHTGN